MCLLSGSSRDASSLEDLLRIEGFLDLVGRKGRGLAGWRRAEDGMVEGVIVDAKVGVTIEVGEVIKPTGEIGDT